MLSRSVRLQGQPLNRRGVIAHSTYLFVSKKYRHTKPIFTGHHCRVVGIILLKEEPETRTKESEGLLEHLIDNKEVI